MILDPSPETIQVIITKAEQQGLTPEQMLKRDYAESYDDLLADRAGLYSDMDNTVLSDEQFEFMLNLLENPPPLTSTAKAFLRGDYV